MSDRGAAWMVLSQVAVQFARSTTGDKAAAQALHDAALAYAAASKPVATASKPARTGARSGAVVPFGRDKGVPIEEADTKSLRWLAGAMRESIADPAKEKWADKNRQLLDAIEAELETR